MIVTRPVSCHRNVLPFPIEIALSSSPAAQTPASVAALAVPALVLGAMAMGVSPIFVRLADVGPFASAFWRVGGALPILFAWGEHDVTAHPDRVGPWWVDGRPERQWRVVPDAGHWVQFEQAEATNRMLLEFFGRG